MSYNKMIKWQLVSQGMDAEDEVPVQIRLFCNEMMCGHSFSVAGNASEVQIVDTVWILKYLADLNEHNNREWFNTHKAETKAATEQFEELVQALILRIGEFDSSVLHIQPKDTVFTLIQYPRFGQDRTPYNPVFRAHIASKGKLPVPVGYYLMIKPGGSLFSAVDCLPIHFGTQLK